MPTPRSTVLRSGLPRVHKVALTLNDAELAELVKVSDRLGVSLAEAGRKLIHDQMAKSEIASGPGP